MKLEDVMRNITVFIEPQETSGCYIANVRGFTPDGEYVKFDIELSGCYTEQILKDTIAAQLEEILECKYHYELGDIEDEYLHYDGGIFLWVY